MLWVLLGFTIIVLVNYGKVATGKYVFSGPDSLVPTALNAGARLIQEETGEYPLWQPGLFSGMPTLHAFTGVSRHYLPNPLGYWLLAIGIPFTVFHILHLIFAGMGTVVLLRSLKISWGGSILGGSGFMLMPYINTMLVHGHGSQMMTLAYLPWAIWALLRLYQKNDLLSAGMLALITGLHLQRGHVQISYYIMMLTGLIFIAAVYRGYKDPERSAKTNGRFLLYSAAAVGLGIAMALSLYLPVINYTPFSIRGAGAAGGTGFAYATQWSFSFGETMTFLLPSFYGFGGVTYWGNMPFTDYPNYMGIILLLLAGWAVYKERKWLVITLAVGTLLAYLVSMGHNFFLYKIFFDFLPFFKKFRVPTMILVLTQFGVATLAAIGFDHLLTWLDELKADAVRKFWLGLGLLLGGLLLIFLLTPAILGSYLPIPRGIRLEMVSTVQNLRLDLIRMDTLVFALLMLGAIGSLWAWLKGHISKMWLTVIIIGLSIIDLNRIDRAIISPSRESLRRSTIASKSVVDRFLAADDVTDFFQADSSTFRIYPLGNLMNENRWAAFGIESIGGYHAAKLANYEKFKATTQFRSAGIFQMLNVKYLVSTQRFEDPRFEEVHTGSFYTGGTFVPVAVYRFKEHIARGWFPQEVRYVPEVDQVLSLVSDQTYDPRQVVYVRDETLAQRQLSTARLLDAEWDPNHARLEIESAGETMIVISEIYYPVGWIARIDGEETPIHEVNSVLRGVQVSGGIHELTLDFEPADIALGSLISKIATLLVLVTITAGWAYSSNKIKFIGPANTNT
jgi:hypothetical protein